MWSTFPINAGAMIFSTVLPLYVLRIRGNILDVTSLFTVYYLALIPFFVIWGVVIDKLHRRRFFFALSFAGCAVVFFAMFLFPSIPALFLLMSLYAVSITASSPIAGLLVMETIEKDRWYNVFGILYFVANGGSAAGLLVGLLWPESVPVNYLLIVASAFCALSVVLTYAFLKDPPQLVALAKASESRVSFSTVAGRLQVIIMMPLRSFSGQSVRRLRAALASGGSGSLSLLFVSGTIYWVGSALLSASYVAYLASRGVSDNAVFGITLANMVFQLVGYGLAGRLAARLSGTRVGLYGIVLTGLSYLLIGFWALGLGRWNLIPADLAFYSLTGLGFAVWTISTSRALYSNLGEKSQAGVVGAYGAVTSLGTVVGSFASGLFSFYIGYYSTFIVAALTMAPSLEFLRRAFLVERRTSERPIPAGSQIP